MEGNACYKFSTIRNYIAQTGAKPIRLCLDVGANVGDIATLLTSYFPTARVHAFEGVREYFDIARSRTAHIPAITVHHRAITGEHRFRDDLGAFPRQTAVPLKVLKAVAQAGPGWVGGSVIIPADVTPAQAPYGYEHYAVGPRAATFDQIVRAVLRLEKTTEIDIVKMDCEGCEHSGLGCASRDTLSRVRFVAGEYHGIERFFRVMQARLFSTHRVSLIGDRDLGAFFAERIDASADGILRANKEGMLQLRPWLAPVPLEWHLFDEQYVEPAERIWHGMS
jgi:hypothetical protein